MALFEAHDLHLRFGDRVVLENVSLAFEAGKLSGIMGPNGAGKTTCFNVLTGRYKPDRGRVLFDGTRHHRPLAAGDRPPRRRALVPAHDPVRRVHGVRERGHRAAGDARARWRCAGPGLCRSGAGRRGATTFWTRSASPTAPTTRRSRCSYGARRALEIAVALACRPKLLFLDEPTAGLGSDGRARLADLVRKLKGLLTIVIIEHDMEFLFSLADEISVIHWGQVIARGTPAELKANPWVEASNLGTAQLMLDVAAIDTFYGETQALFGVSLSVRAGEVLALLGANGAGKTTVLRSILGPDARAARRHPLPGQLDHGRADARDRARRHRLGAGRPPPVPDADGRQEPVARREAHRLPRLVDERGDRHLHAAQIPDGARGRDAVGRRDADGGDCPRAARRAGPDAVRRAEPGAGAEDRRRRAGRDPPA